jgi:spoIIIJ-associated protein
MNGIKNFQGKTLDEAIMEACGYYGVPREKLEIEIVNDAKSGIFGLVGVKKAEIRAARMQVAETLSSMLDDENAGDGEKTPPSANDPVPPERMAAGRVGHPRGPRSAGHGTGAPSGQETERAVSPGRDPSGNAGQTRSREREAFPESATGEPHSPQPPLDRAGAFDDETGEYDPVSRGDMREFDPAGIDPDELSDLVRSVVVGLAAPIVGEAPCRVDIGERWVRAVLDCGDDAGLLVGREGQTLAALQYLAGRITARKLGAPLRLHVDAGRYLERREDRLKDLALSLAERAKATRRAQATRPLSAYQRRIVHLTLENDPDVLTHSKGEGLQRRVFIYLKNAAADMPVAAGARSSGHARAAEKAFSAGGPPRFAGAAPYAADTPVAADGENLDLPDPWNR